MRMKVGSTLVAFLAVAVLGGGSQPAFAYGPEGLFGGRPQPDSSVVLGSPIEIKTDRPDRAESVLEHPRSDFDPVPMELGSFAFLPSLELGEAYDNNIYAGKTNEANDTITSVRPILSLYSNWGRHAVSSTTYGDVNFFADHTHENFSNFVTDWNGRYDIVNQSWFSVHGGYQHLSEPRSSPDAVNGTDPTTFDVVKGGLGYHREIGTLKLGVDYDLQRFDFDSTKTSTGSIDQSQRNRFEHVIGTKLSYDLSGNVKPYIQTHLNSHDYENNTIRQSNGYDAVVGSTFDFGGITSLDLYAGAMGRDFRNWTVSDKDLLQPKFGGRLDWNVTSLTSVAFEVSRSIEETTLANANSYTASGGSATLTHELMRNLLLEGDFGFTRNDYNGSVTRTDDVLSAGGGARYFLNRNIYSDLSYAYSDRASDVSSAEYNKHVVMLRVGFRP